MIFPSSSDLMYFYEVAMHLNLSRAARKLNVSQPSLSVSIKKLESQLGEPLLIRHQQGVTLTRAGNELVVGIQKFKNVWFDTLSSIKESSEKIKGVIHIGCHSTLTPFMGNMISHLMENNPSLLIHLHHKLTPLIMDKVVAGAWDIGIVTDPYPHQEIILKRLADTEFTFFSTQSVDLKSDAIYILCNPQLPQTHYLLNQLVQLRGSNNFRINYVEQIESIAFLTSQGCGLGILPTAFSEFCFEGKLFQIANAPVYRKPLYLAYRKENKEVYSIRVILDELISITTN